MFQFVYREGGDCVAPVKGYPAGASKTFARGEMVILASGLLSNGVAASTAVVGICNETISNATAEGDPVEVILGLEDVVFKCDYIGTGKTALTNADIGTAFDYNASNAAIDLDDTTGGMWVVVGFDNTKKKALVKLAAGSRASILG